MHSIYKQGNLPYLNVKVCPKCEQLVDENESVCPKCSHDFSIKQPVEVKEKQVVIKKEEPVETSKVEPLIDDKNVVSKVNSAKDKVMFCDNCGAKIIGPQKYCGGCGVKVSKTICPSCLQIIDSHLLFCPLCGEKLQDPTSNVASSPVDVSNQPIEPVINNDIKEEIVVDEVVTDSVPVVSNEEPEEVKIETSNVFSINIVRKRIFLAIQMIVVCLVALVMLYVPILTKSNFFGIIGLAIKQELSSETMATGFGVIDYIVNAIKSASLQIDQSSMLYQMIVYDGSSIYSENRFVLMMLDLFNANSLQLTHALSLYCTVSCYIIISLALLIAFLSAFFGMFSKKKPYKGKALGFLIIALLIGILFVYSATFTQTYKGYDSWLLYGFVLCFFLWFIVKIVFLKEVKKYNSYKNQ